MIIISHIYYIHSEVGYNLLIVLIIPLPYVLPVCPLAGTCRRVTGEGGWWWINRLYFLPHPSPLLGRQTSPARRGFIISSPFDGRGWNPPDGLKVRVDFIIILFLPHSRPNSWSHLVGVLPSPGKIGFYFQSSLDKAANFSSALPQLRFSK